MKLAGCLLLLCALSGPAEAVMVVRWLNPNPAEERPGQVLTVTTDARLVTHELFAREEPEGLVHYSVVDVDCDGVCTVQGFLTDEDGRTSVASLPPVQLPEPGAFTLVGGCALLWVLQRRRGTHLQRPGASGPGPPQSRPG